MSGSKKSELEMRDKAILHQQRRLKQATQFSHKDSADLLPLDGLKRLGTTKDLQPHSIVQRRLLEGNITRLRGETRAADAARVRSPLADSKEGGDAEERSESTAEDSTEERESPEESERSLKSDDEEDEEGKRTSMEEKRTAEKGMAEKQQEGRPGVEETERALTLTALVVRCKCCETEVNASINTGCQHNTISLAYCRRLGLMLPPEDRAYEQTVGQRPVVDTTLPHTVKDLLLQLGRERTMCSACVVEDEVFELSLGLQTLLELKCCVDLSSRVLRLSGSGEELPFLDMPTEGQFRHDNNKNTTM